MRPVVIATARADPDQSDAIALGPAGIDDYVNSQGMLLPSIHERSNLDEGRDRAPRRSVGPVGTGHPTDEALRELGLLELCWLKAPDA